MDDLFCQPGKGPQMECIEEVDETTALLLCTPPATFSRKTGFYWIPGVNGW